MRRCLYQHCQRFATFNFDSVIKTPVYCKQHAELGMVDVCSKRCLHNSCTKKSSFNVEGSKTPAYCKQHAGDGMVCVIGMRCSHASCRRHPSFNVKGSKKALFCKQHAEDGMVNVISKRCSHDSCTKYPSFNLKGATKSVFCKQHAQDGMINVRNKRCSHDSCTRQSSFNTSGSKKAVFCKQHAEDGMVNVFGKRRSRNRCTTVREKRPAIKVTACPRTKHKSDSLHRSLDKTDSSGEVGNRRKRSKRVVDGRQPPHRLYHGPFKGDDGCTVRTGPSTEGPHTLCSVASPRYLCDSHTVRTAAKPTRQVMPRAVGTSSDEHQSGEHIKTELELVVSL